MKNAFSAVSGTLNKFVDFVYLSLLWFLCSIPIVTIGASTGALYYAIQKSVIHGRSYPGKEFFHSFKKNFRQLTVLWLGFLLFAAAMLLGAYLSRQGVMPEFFLYIYVAILAILLIVALHSFAYIARFEGESRQVLTNCFFITVSHPIRSLLSLFLTVAAAIAVWVFFPLIFILPALVIWGIGSMLEKTFALYLSDEQKQTEFERNRVWEN